MKKISKVILAAALVLLVLGVFAGAAAASDDLKQPSAQVSEQLQGKAAGVVVLPSSGQPGSGMTIRVRDLGLLSAFSYPLIAADGEDVAKANTSQPLTALQGSAPGVNITQSNSQPGNGFKVNLRGIGTVGSSSPLVVVDGVTLASAFRNSLGGINPSDIESISVLKDAGAAAIYGSRAANSAAAHPVSSFVYGVQKMFSGFLASLFGVSSFVF